MSASLPDEWISGTLDEAEEQLDRCFRSDPEIYGNWTVLFRHYLASQLKNLERVNNSLNILDPATQADELRKQGQRKILNDLLRNEGFGAYKALSIAREGLAGRNDA